MSTADDIKTIGLKVTAPRRIILELFRNARDAEGMRHMGAEDIYTHLRERGQDMALATIYRVLTQFEHVGLLLRHHFESGKAVFELNEGRHHDHIVCLQCGRVEEFFDAAIEQRQEQITEKHGYRLVAHEMHLYAECLNAECAGRKSVALK